MNEVLTVAEIHARFPAEWVLLGDPQTDPYQGVQAGIMIWHSKDREEVDRKAIETPYRHIALLPPGSKPVGSALWVSVWREAGPRRECLL